MQLIKILKIFKNIQNIAFINTEMENLRTVFCFIFLL